MELSDIAEMVLRAMGLEVEEKGLKLAIRKRREEQCHCVLQCQESRKRRSRPCKQCGDTWS